MVEREMPVSPEKILASLHADKALWPIREKPERLSTLLPDVKDTLKETRETLVRLKRGDPDLDPHTTRELALRLSSLSARLWTHGRAARTVAEAVSNLALRVDTAVLGNTAAVVEAQTSLYFACVVFRTGLKGFMP